jgi:hypothetical protein
MAEMKIRDVPGVDEAGELVGLLRQRDLLACAVQIAGCDREG